MLVIAGLEPTRAFAIARAGFGGAHLVDTIAAFAHALHNHFMHGAAVRQFVGAWLQHTFALFDGCDPQVQSAIEFGARFINDGGNHHKFFRQRVGAGDAQQGMHAGIAPKVKTGDAHSQQALEPIGPFGKHQGQGKQQSKKNKNDDEGKSHVNTRS